MSAFPKYEQIKFNNPLTCKLQFKTLTSGFEEAGVEKRRKKWLYPKRNIILVYAYISKTNATTLWQFYMERYGIFQSFRFFFPITHTVSYKEEYIGTGDAVNTVYTLPSCQASAIRIYIGATEVFSPADFSVNLIGGADGADLITFTSPPADGSHITMDFVGPLVVQCRFAEDQLEYIEFYNRLVNMGISLKGLLNSE